MSTRLKISYYLRSNYKNKEGKSPIMARIYLSGEMATLSTGINVNADLWSSTHGHLKGKTVDARKANLEIDRFTNMLFTILKRFDDDEFISADQFKSTVLGKDKETARKLLDAAEMYLENFRALVGTTRKKSTLGKYETTKTKLKDYISEKYGRDDIRLIEIDYRFVEGFDIFLKTTGKCKPNTVARYMRRFKTIIIFARNSGFMSFDPFANFKIKMEREDRGYLTDEEIDKILSKKFTIPRMEQVRDLFIFACFTGLSYIDVVNLTENNIVKENGQLWINTKREKTDVRSNIPLLEIPLKIINKYKKARKDDKLLPMLSNQKLNSYLKEIADICQINKSLTYHLARHTFATTVTLSKGVPIETVSRMLGHTSIKTTQIYARVTTKKIQDDMTVLAGKLDSFTKKAAI